MHIVILLIYYTDELKFMKKKCKVLLMFPPTKIAMFGFLFPLQPLNSSKLTDTSSPEKNGSVNSSTQRYELVKG